MDEQSGIGLPASIQAAWGLRERPGKGPKPGLSLGRIVEAAVNLASSDGLAAVSMSRVAAELGVSTMSLYRYVAAKDELLALMVDAALGQPPPASSDDGWRAGLSRWAWAAPAFYRRNPWTLRVPIGGPPTTPNQIAWLEQGLRCLRDTGLAEGEKFSVILLVAGFVRNWATLEADVGEAAAGSGTSAEEAMSGYGRLLGRLTDPQRFPALHAVIEAGVLDRPKEPNDPNSEFVFGLERVLNGIDTLVQERAPTYPPG